MSVSLLCLVILALLSGAAVAQGSSGEVQEPPPPAAPAQRMPAAGGLASAVDVAYLKGKKPVAPDAVTALGPDTFGDRVNLFNGAFSFEQTDISIPGNNELSVAVVRTHSPGRSWLVRGVLADWDLNIPRIEGTFAVPEGWTANGDLRRCSSRDLSPPILSRGYRDQEGFFWNAEFQPWEYWQGTTLTVPGQGSQEVLANSRLPTLGGLWPLTTRQQWQIGCLPTVINAPGEGFIARSPSGVTYHFNWMASRLNRELRKGTGLQRADMYLLATRVTDRFGKWVQYHYDPARPLNLLRIDSSDGRVITLRYSGDRLVSASDGEPGTPGVRTWTYGYLPNGDLGSVTQPDGRAWHFNLRGFVGETDLINEGNAHCDAVPSPMGLAGSGTITHPSGAVGHFEADYVYQPRSNVPRQCTYYTGELAMHTNGSVHPRETVNFALTRKTITAPGAEPMVWVYGGSGPAFGTWAPCTECPASKIRTVVEPDGSWKRHEFGIRWRENEGQLLKVEEGGPGSSMPLRTTEYSYRLPAGNCPDSFGDSSNLLFDWNATVNRPQGWRHIRQQSVSMTWEGITFDCRARVTESRSYSSLGTSRRERLVYSDDFIGKGIVGLLVSRQVSPDGNSWLLAEQNSFHADSALVHVKQAFGRVEAIFDYWDQDGTLRGLQDGNGNRTVFSQYHRGRPQRVDFPDGAFATQVINNAGWTTEHVNEVNARHVLSYDPMGRLTRIKYPTGDPVAYCDTILSFSQASSAERGLPPGHWRQRVDTCGDVTERWFDGLWRLRLERRYDSAKESTTAKTTETRYDKMGRPAFTSRALRDIPTIGVTMVGRHIKHRDGLGRVTEEFEQGHSGARRTTLTIHEDLLRREVVNPKGFKTKTWFQVFDEPTEDHPTRIEAPEGVVVEIGRDFLGKALWIERAGPSPQGIVSARRSYVYSPKQLLCKTLEPEIGATVRDYDNAGNLIWTATGLDLPGSGCDQTAVPTHRRISHGYDTRNRLKWTSHGDGSGRVERTYFPDGQLQSLTSSRVGRNTITWLYDYYRAGMPKEERYTWGDPNNYWSFQYQVDQRRQRQAYSDPLRGWLSLEPDALGRPTRVGMPDSSDRAYVSGARYHPDGSLAQYTLGNGIVFNNELGDFGRPELWQHVGRSSHVYRYDANDNVIAIDDLLGGRHRSMPWYDGLDRLRQANGPWGAGHYEYDGLDNIVSSTVGTRTLVHEYDRVRNRLTRLSGSQPMTFDYDNGGNVVGRGSTRFSFDIANRLLSSSAHRGVDYDGHGRRNLTWWMDGSYRHSAYTQDGLLRLDWHSNEGARRYVYLGGKLVAEAREPRFGGEVTYVHTDMLGSPILRTNAAGAQVERTAYEPYGLTTDGSTDPARIGFTGHVNDRETGLVYMQQRYYDPVAGRFLSVDPVTTDAKTGGFFGRYHYANNNPYRFFDPDGRSPCTGTRIEAACGMFGNTMSDLQHAIKNFQTAVEDWARASADGFKSASAGDTLNKVLAAAGPAAALRGAVGRTTAKGLTKPSAHSVVFETTVAKSGAGTREAHKAVANRDLAAAMSDREFAQMLSSMGVKLTSGSATPTGFIWHHAPGRPGVMQLVPEAQHTPGSAFWDVLHPGGSGGFAQWGKSW
jgi:RHS repeat-associated protein